MIARPCPSSRHRYKRRWHPDMAWYFTGMEEKRANCMWEGLFIYLFNELDIYSLAKPLAMSAVGYGGGGPTPLASQRS